MSVKQSLKIVYTTIERIIRLVFYLVANGAINALEKALQDDGGLYMSPTVLINASKTSIVMREELFGPVVGVVPVSDDQEAIDLINDTKYGLTASIWTFDRKRAVEIGAKLEVGTVFLNKCDQVEPSLAWIGVKSSGLGFSLSKLCFDHVTRPKSYNL